MMRLLRITCLVSLAAIFASCATKPSPALQHVQTAPDPVEATLRANEHLRNSLFLIRSHGPSARTSAQCTVLFTPVADSAEACATAYKKLLKLNTITAAQQTRLNKSFARVEDCIRKCLPGVQALALKSRTYIDYNDVFYSGKRAIFWMGEATHLGLKVYAKKFTVIN